MINTAAPAIDIPAIAAVEIEDEPEADLLATGAVVGPVGVGVIVVVVEAVAVGVVVGLDVGTISDGKYSPGLNMRVEFFANSIWTSSVSVSF